MGNLDVLNRFVRLYEEVFTHDGFGEIRVEMKILRKGQKEVILHCGKQYRFVVDYAERQPLRWGVWRVVEERPGSAAREEKQDKRTGGDRRREARAIGFPDKRSGRDRRQRT
ncbi:MAG TPA: hypothetical protein PKH69_05525 [Thiobacillaceae bacterium]|nr:hypothetical protein [Thiobacillaceae bacterium]HNU64167.1 hypothetical protein [Thiobacillaceae bacterium]